jgi:hypothetical protein
MLNVDILNESTVRFTQNGRVQIYPAVFFARTDSASTGRVNIISHADVGEKLLLQEHYNRISLNGGAAFASIAECIMTLNEHIGKFKR